MAFRASDSDYNHCSFGLARSAYKALDRLEPLLLHSLSNYRTFRFKAKWTELLTLTFYGELKEVRKPLKENGFGKVLNCFETWISGIAPALRVGGGGR